VHAVSKKLMWIYFLGAMLISVSVWKMVKAKCIQMRGRRGAFISIIDEVMIYRSVITAREHPTDWTLAAEYSARIHSIRVGYP